MNFLKVLNVIILFFILSGIMSAKYCTPPKYYSGPFTGITNVKFGSIDFTTKYNDGYSDFTNTGKIAQLTAGSSDSIFLTLYYDPSMLSYFAGNLNIRVWIDWNQDSTFQEPSETVVSAVVNCGKSTVSNPYTKFSASITVPANAKTGITRMRVYEDMSESDGHITPNPCGYLGSSNQLGQHGECEDYTINVTGESWVDDNNYLSGMIGIFPNPANESSEIFIQLQKPEIGDLYIYDMTGNKIRTILNNSYLSTGINQYKIDFNGMPCGNYLLEFKTEEKVIIRKLIIN